MADPAVTRAILGENGWRFHRAVTEPVEVTARLQEDAWRDRLLWSEACAGHTPDGRTARQPVIDVLTEDAGELLSFALVSARKH